MAYTITELFTGMPVLLSPAPETPRTALAVAIFGGVRRETIPGTARLASRLLLKGTEKRDAETLARELDEHAIEIREMTLSDCSVLAAVFLTRELPAVLDLVQDILLHSTFEHYDKEAAMLAGEIQSSQDMPGERAQDLLGRTLFRDHPYGHTGTRILDGIPRLDAGQVRGWHAAGLNPRQMAVAVVGDIDADSLLPELDDLFAELPERPTLPPAPALERITADQVVTDERRETQQAQVIQGWYAPPLGAPQHAALLVMNTILGGGGLSNRLFLELRDKQGLAYSVWSQYVPMLQTGEFLMSIGTSPENIDRARAGFAEQLARMQNEPITLEELENAKGRLRGSFVLGKETNSQRCMDMLINQVEGMGADYSLRLLHAVEGVTVADVQAAAQLIASPSATAIVLPATGKG